MFDVTISSTMTINCTMTTHYFYVYYGYKPRRLRSDPLADQGCPTPRLQPRGVTSRRHHNDDSNNNDDDNNNTSNNINNSN